MSGEAPSLTSLVDVPRSCGSEAASESNKATSNEFRSMTICVARGVRKSRRGHADVRFAEIDVVAEARGSRLM
jgi:hypothetical protein